MENIIKNKKGRPKGSQNKPKILTKNNSSVISIKMEKQVEGMARTTNSNRGWINWGNRNDYPLQLSNLYYNSPIHQSCVDFAVSAIVGGGVDYDKMKLTGQEELRPNYMESWDSFIEKIALDYILYGAYAFQIIKNKDNKTYSFYHQPFSDVRCSPKDEDGVITSYWVSSDWTALSKYSPVELPAFGFQEDEEIAQGKTYLFVSTSYSPDLLYYQTPRYISALKAIQADIELQRYDLRSIMNNFSASGVLTMNRIDDDEERKLVLENLEAMFQGSDNANSLLVTFKNNDEEKPIDFVKIDKDVTNVNLFDNNNERNIKRILSAHRIPSRTLIGLPSENAQLGGQGNETVVAYNIYNQLVGNNNRKKIVSTINQMLRINGIDVSVELKPLQFYVNMPSEIIEEDKNENINENTEETYSSENVEEQKTNLN